MVRGFCRAVDLESGVANEKSGEGKRRTDQGPGGSGHRP